ncbi:hypothetical protein [Infirmifilum uzonense]|nr:hypothetical protein [Infirmifilum uzonense]
MKESRVRKNYFFGLRRRVKARTATTRTIRIKAKAMYSVLSA